MRRGFLLARRKSGSEADAGPRASPEPDTSSKRGENGRWDAASGGDVPAGDDSTAPAPGRGPARTQTLTEDAAGRAGPSQLRCGESHSEMGAPQEASQDASRPQHGPVLAPLEQTASLDHPAQGRAEKQDATASPGPGSSTGAQMPISSQGSPLPGTGASAATSLPSRRQGEAPHAVLKTYDVGEAEETDAAKKRTPTQMRTSTLTSSSAEARKRFRNARAAAGRQVRRVHVHEIDARESLRNVVEDVRRATDRLPRRRRRASRRNGGALEDEDEDDEAALSSSSCEPGESDGETLALEDVKDDAKQGTASRREPVPCLNENADVNASRLTPDETTSATVRHAVEGQTSEDGTDRRRGGQKVLLRILRPRPGLAQERTTTGPRQRQRSQSLTNLHTSETRAENSATRQEQDGDMGPNASAHFHSNGSNTATSANVVRAEGPSPAPSREATPTRQANGASVGGAAVGGATVDGAATASGDSQTNAPMSPQTVNRKMAPRQLFKRMNEKLVLHQQLLLQVPKRGGPQQLDKDAEEHVTCSICLNTYDEPVKTSCGHIFCRKCLEQTKQHHLQQQQQQQQQRTTQALRHEQLQTLQIRLPRAAGHVVSQRINPVPPQTQPRTQLQSQAQAQVPQHQAVHPPATAANGAGSVLPGLNTSAPQAQGAHGAAMSSFPCPLCRSQITQNIADLPVAQDMVSYMERFVVTCTNRGCKAAVRLADFRAHLRACDWVVTPCMHAKAGCEWRSLKKDLQAHLEVCPYHAIRRFYPLVFGKLEHVHSLAHELQATIATHEEVFRHQLRHLVQLKHLDITSFRDNLRMLGLYFWWPQRLVRTQAQWFQFSVFLQISLLFLWPLLACTYITAGGSIHAGDTESFFRIPANASMTLKDLWAEGVAHASNFTRSPAISPTAFLPEILGTTGNPMRIGLCDAAIFPEWSCMHMPVVLVLLCSFVLLEVGLLEGSHSEHKLRIKIYNTAQPNTNGARPSRVEVGPSVAEPNAPQGARAWRFVIREQIAPLEVLLGLVVCLLFSQLSLGYQIVLAVAFLPGLCLHETVADHNFVRPVLAGAFVGFQCAWVHPRVLVAANILAIVHTPYCPVFAEDDAFASRVRLASVGLMHLALPEVYFMGFALSTGLFYAGRTGLPALRRRLQSSINEASPDPVCQGVLALGLTAQAMLTWKTLLVAIERTLVYSTA